MSLLRAVSDNSGAIPLNIESIRQEFPILSQEINGKPLVYLDNAASSQTPQAVMDAIVDCYSRYYANVHRGVHTLSQRCTDAYEGAREKVRAFINAKSTREIIYTSGTTGSINLVTTSFGRSQLKAGDEILISTLEHHSNIVPWQMLCEQTGARLKVIPVADNGELMLDAYQQLLNERTRIVSVVHVSNALGTINPVRAMIEMAHARGIPVLLDGAQAVPHMAVDVQALDCDFYAFSGHKMYGPNGIGILYGKAEYLEAMPPYQGGGEMILSVTFEKSEYAGLPHKFEAGTPNIADAIGLGAAIDWIRSIGLDAIETHERDLLEYATAQFRQIPGLSIIGNARDKAGVLSFVLEGIHPHDIGTIVDREGVAIRTGHHCAQPVMQRFDVPATARASFAVYNTRPEIDALVSSIYQVKEMFER
jgi:cysteine desulfurase/selenocysteine lyase